jgi:hypothetical protein
MNQKIRATPRQIHIPSSSLISTMEVDHAPDVITGAVRYVKLISAEGLEYLIDREIVRSHSGALRKMLDSNFKEAMDGIIQLPEMSGYILERVVFYLHHKQQYSKVTGRVPEFVRFAILVHCYERTHPSSSRGGRTGDRTRSGLGNAPGRKVSRLLIADLVKFGFCLYPPQRRNNL